MLNTAAGFLLASNGNVQLGLMVATLSGTALVIASACVVNNYFDKKIDAKMTRTKYRGLASGQVSVISALIYAATLGALGFTMLAAFTNWLTFALGVIAYVFYAVVYGYAKRKSVHGTLIGTIPGAIPPVAGYTAVSGSLDGAAWILFLILIFWQMPHFYAIAIYRIKDYKSAGLPVSPISRGIKATKVHIFIYVIGFGVAVSVLTLAGYTGYTFLIALLVVWLLWLRLTYQGFGVVNDTRWAKQDFKFSLIAILVLDVMLAVGPVLP